MVWKRDDQMGGPSGGWPVYGSNRLRVASRITARDVPPVFFLLSRKVGCREAPLNHPGDTRLLGQAGDGGDPRGAVAAVTTAQAEREFGHAHAGMRVWMDHISAGSQTCLSRWVGEKSAEN